jgi:hypothetical protein
MLSRAASPPRPFPVRAISRLGNDRAYNWRARTVIQFRASKRLDMIDDDHLFNLACGFQSTCHHTAARQRVVPWKAFLDLFTSRSLVLLGPTPQQSRWPTGRPVSYSAGLYDPRYRLYIGQAH